MHLCSSDGGKKEGREERHQQVLGGLEQVSRDEETQRE